MEVKTIMQQPLTINSAQYELLNVLSCVNREEDVAELKTVIVKFINSLLQREIDSLWDNGTLTEEKVAAWKKYCETSPSPTLK